MIEPARKGAGTSGRSNAPGRRVLVAVGVVMFLEALMFSSLAPLLPTYETRFALGKVGAGILVGCFAVGLLAGAAMAGTVADRRGGKPVVVIGVTLMLIAGVAFGLADSIALLEPARLLQGVGAGMIWAGGPTWLAASTPPDRQGTAFGTVIGVAVGGALVGPPLGGLAAISSTGLVFSILLPTVLLVALVLVVLTPGGGPTRSEGSALDLLRRPYCRDTLGAVAALLLPASAAGMINTLGPLRLSAVGATVGVLTLVYVLAGIAEGVASPLTGRLADRGDPNALVGRLLFALAVVLVAFAAVRPGWLLALMIVAIGGVLGLLWAPANSRTQVVAQGARVSDSRVFAIFTFCFAGGQLVGGTGGGALAAAGGYALPPLLLAFAAAIAATSLSSG